LIMLISRNAVEVSHIVRIKKCGGDLFLEKIHTLKVRYNFFENTRSQTFVTSVPKTKRTQHTWVYPQG